MSYVLVYYSDDTYYVCSVKNIFNREGEKATVKYKNGIKYAARIIAFNDSEEILTSIKDALCRNLRVERRNCFNDRDANPICDPKDDTEHKQKKLRKKWENQKLIDKLPAREVAMTPHLFQTAISSANSIVSLGHMCFEDANNNISFNYEDNVCRNSSESPSLSKILPFPSEKLNIDSVPLQNGDTPEVVILYQDQMSSDYQDFTPISEVNEMLLSPSICQISYPRFCSNSNSLEYLEVVTPENNIWSQTMAVLDHDYISNKSIVDETILLSVSNDHDDSYQQGLDRIRDELFPREDGSESGVDPDADSDSNYIPTSNSEKSSDSDSTHSRDIARSSTPSICVDPLSVSLALTTSLEDSIDPVPVPPTPKPYGEVNIMNVPTSGSIPKKYFCTFCKKLVSKIARHLETVHKDEDCVKAFSALPKCNPERRKLINLIRGTGTFEFNTNANYNNGDLKVCRRPQTKKNRKSTHYECCPKCKDYFSKITFKRHCDKCLGNLKKNDRTVTVMGKRCRASVHSKASDILKNHVFPPLREDDVVRSIRYDEFVILYANLLCEQYRSPHNYKMIRSHLRLIGRFLLIMKRLEPLIKTVVDCFQPKYFDKALVAIDEIAELDTDSHLYKKPTVALNVGTILRKMANFYISECIKREDQLAKRQTKDFISLIDVNFNPKVSQTAFESRLQLSRKKKIELPSMEDIRLLNKYLNDNLKTYYEQLSIKFDYNTWKQLASLTLLSLIFFNRRRVGESERLKIIDFEGYQSVDENSDKEIFNSLSAGGKKAAQSFVRIVVRGKLGRNVAILLNKLYFNCVKLVLKHRESAGVLRSNPYVFGLPNEPDDPPKHLQACALMRIHSVKCQALKPHLLRGTILRKHIATQSVLLNLTEEEVSDLANYMGHADKIHKSHYRLPIVSREIAQISKLLQKAQGDEPEGEESDEDEAIMNYRFSNTTKSKQRWSTPEREVVEKEFAEYYKKKCAPSAAKCKDIIELYPILKHREPIHLKAKINNDIRRRQNEEDKLKKLKKNINNIKY
ncbi:hypothetical protein NQ314_014533 [Rhamnusium bicolor]|uniref:Uncharacterized protein n=1 Tax=Rhamnusium bicolor TaxID=1586634 RepID=A0AAV8X3W5_9CUCU|nr:hypothetical protein NQ314_014533 [Rhamnusium bicolor]